MRVNISEVLNRSSTRLNPRLKPPALSCTWLDYAHQGTLTAWDSPIRPYEVSTPQCPLLPAGQRNPFITVCTSTPYFTLKPTPPPLILHQPRKSWFCVILGQNPQKVNGISVSKPPIFGERPYPRQFHPVGFSRFLPRNRWFSAPHPTHHMSTTNQDIYPTPPASSHSTGHQHNIIILSRPYTKTPNILLSTNHQTQADQIYNRHLYII